MSLLRRQDGSLLRSLDSGSTSFPDSAGAEAESDRTAGGVPGFGTSGVSPGAGPNGVLAAEAQTLSSTPSAGTLQLDSSPPVVGRPQESGRFGQTASASWRSTPPAPSVLAGEASPITAPQQGSAPKLAGTVGQTSAAPVLNSTSSPVSDGSQIALYANVASSLYGVSGAGVKIGIISDSFNALGGASADEADGALPSAGDVNILQDYASGIDEGRAMAQIVHSIAPGAQIDFYSGENGQEDFAAGIAALQADGCQIVVDDLNYLNEPFYQMGDPIERAIRSFVNGGGTYVTAATNAGPQAFYENTWQPGQTALPGIGTRTAMNFGTADAPNYMEPVDLTANQSTTFDLQWAQPWASIDGTGTSYSLGFAVYDPDGNLVDRFSQNVRNGDPIQIGTIDPGVSGTYSVAIFSNAGRDPGGQFKIIGSNDGYPSVSFPDASGSGSIYGHNMDPQAITVGADYYGNSAPFGNAPQSESFSAAGPGELLLNAQGRTFANPIQLHKVNVTGPDGQTTTDPSVSPFFGTSAAAPAVAAVAGLMLQANPSLTYAQIRSILQHTATPFGTPEQAGAGLVQARDAVASVEQGNTSALAVPSQANPSTLLWQNGNVSPSVLQGGASGLPSLANLGPELLQASSLTTAPGETGGVLWDGAPPQIAPPTSSDAGLVASAALSATGGAGRHDILYDNPGRSLSATPSDSFVAGVTRSSAVRLHAST